jgi:hypothetical protein
MARDGRFDRELAVLGRRCARRGAGSAGRQQAVDASTGEMYEWATASHQRVERSGRCATAALMPSATTSSQAGVGQTCAEDPPIGR